MAPKKPVKAAEVAEESDEEENELELMRQTLEQFRAELRQTRSDGEQARQDLRQARQDLEDVRQELRQNYYVADQLRQDLQEARSEVEETLVEAESAKGALREAEQVRKTAEEDQARLQEHDRQMHERLEMANNELESRDFVQTRNEQATDTRHEVTNEEELEDSNNNQLTESEMRVAKKMNACIRFLTVGCQANPCKHKHMYRGVIEMVNEINQNNGKDTKSEEPAESCEVPNIAKYKKGFILKTINGKVGTVWADAEAEGESFKYVVCVANNGTQELLVFREPQLSLFYSVPPKIGDLKLMMGDIIKHEKYGFAEYDGVGRATQLNNYQGQVSPGNVTFQTDENIALVVAPGQARIAQMSWLARQAVNKNYARQLFELVDARMIPPTREEGRLALQRFCSLSGLNNTWIEVLLILAMAIHQGESAFNEALNGIQRVELIGSRESGLGARGTNGVIDLTQSVFKAAEQPASFMASNKYFDTMNYKTYRDLEEGESVSLIDKMKVELENLKMIGVRTSYGIVQHPITGIPVSQDLGKRLSFISYSTADLENAVNYGGRSGLANNTVRELGLIKNPPKLRSTNIKDVRNFCKERDIYLSDLSKLVNEDARMYEPIDLLVCFDRDSRNWLSSMFDVKLIELNRIHADAFLLAMARFDPQGEDRGVSVSDLIKKLEMKWSPGDSVLAYTHQVISKVKDLIVEYDVLSYISIVIQQYIKNVP